MNSSTSLFSVFKSININKILSGANKTIGFVNKAIPTYKQVRPLLGNFKNISSIFSAKKNGITPEISERPIPLKQTFLKNNINDTLTFFQ